MPAYRAQKSELALGLGGYTYLIINHLPLPIVLLQHREELDDVRVLEMSGVRQIQGTEYRNTYVLVELISRPIEAENECARRGVDHLVARRWRRNAGG